MRTEYTQQEAYLIACVLKMPNIKMVELADQMISNPRRVREMVNSIRKKGWITKFTTPLYLIGDNKGYSLEKKGSDRLDEWVRRFSGVHEDMGQVLEVFHQTDLFTNFN